MIIYYTKKGKFKIDNYDKLPFHKLYRANGPTVFF